MSLALAGYTLAALSFAATCLFLLASRWRRPGGRVLAIAAMVTAAWATLLAMAAAENRAPAVLLFLGELIRDAAWLAVAASLLPPVADWRTGRWLRRMALAGPAAGGVLLMAVIGLRLRSPEFAGTLFFYISLALAVFGLVVLEQAYRNSPPESRWSMKFLVFAAGGIFAFDLVLFSHAALYSAMSADLWAARAFANVLMLPLLIIGARRHRELAMELFVSRQAVFFTAGLMGAGLYLVGVALAGYLVRLLGGDWGLALQAVFVFAALMALTLLWFSQDLRSRLKVFISKHFYANKYDYREQWLGLTARLANDELAADTRVRVIRALAPLAGAGGGALWLADPAKPGEPLTLAAAWQAWDLPRALERDGLLDLLAGRRWVVHTADLDARPEHYDGVPAPGWVRDSDQPWLLVPLSESGELFGVLGLRSPRVGPRLDYEDIDILKTASRQIVAVLRQEQASRALAESRQFETYNRLTAFLMHDLKNLVAQQSLVVRNAEKYKHDPEFVDDVIETIANSVARMERVIEQLRRGEPGGLARRVSLREAVGQALAQQKDMQPAARLSTDGGEAFVRADVDRLVPVLAHVIRNAQEASDAEAGRVEVSVRQEEGAAVVRVEDDGAGMDESFLRDRLFKPFDSTKGSKGMGIGAYQVRQFVEEAGGEVRVTSRPGEGTTFELRFPLAAAPGEAELEGGKDGPVRGGRPAASPARG